MEKDKQIKRFASTPNYTVPKLEGYKLPEIPKSREDDAEGMAKELLKSKWAHLYRFGHPKKPYPTDYENELNNVINGIYKAREKYEFTLYDIRKAFLNGIAITGEGANGEYCNGNSPDIEHEFGQNADIYIESITRIPIAIEVEMVEVKVNPMGRIVDPMDVGQNQSSCKWEQRPATHPDGTVKGVWVYE